MRRFIDELRLLHAIRMAVVAADTDGAITFVNEAAAELYGSDGADLVGADLLSFAVGPEQETAGRRALDLVLAGHTWRGDLPVRRADGSTFLAGISSTPIRNEHGDVTGVIVVSEDMTDIRRAEQDTAAKDQRLRLAYRAAALGTWHWDIDTGVTVWDEQLEAIFGLPPGGFDGSFDHWVSLLHPDDRDRVFATLDEAIATRSTYLTKHRVVWPDGSVRWLEGVGQVLVGDDGEPTGTLGCSRDVTERVEAELAVAEAFEAERAAARRAEALVVERERLAARLSGIAEHLQSSLAANPLSTVAGVEIAAHYSPGGDDLEHIGGDWYDAVGHPDGSLSLVVGDVMGRGVQAATTMIWVRAGIRGLVTVNPSPADVLRSADRLLARDDPEQFVTAFAVLLDAERRRLLLSNAGHVPAVVVHADGRTELLGTGSGVPLGVADGPARRNAHHDLTAGALVVLVTDGVVEGRGYHLDEGIRRLAERAAAHRTWPLEELVADLAALADPGVDDDVTVVAARLG